MPFSESYEQRQILERTTARLNQLAPDNITTNNARRFDELPPPYTSKETTRSPSPLTHDNVSQPDMQAPISVAATPLTMFGIQTRYQIDRLQEQISLETDGRTQTFPFDKSSDLRANAENNVRSMWLEQEIWGDEWGGAWPSNSFPMDNMWQWSRAKSSSRPRPHGRWKHEQAKLPNRSEAGDFHTSTTFSHIAETAKSPTEVTTYTGSDTANTDASRPVRQFAYQVNAEMGWLRDGYEHKSQLPNEIDQIAHNHVKQMWLKEGIWDPVWGQSPGILWAHEAPHLDPRMRFDGES
ncbi:hypothetical protein LTR78_007428 [Recurvomyces mirabilis]|uniref:Uncharacterized protein n=1 Tax=Recurvomyces mirabilis TaxID=574656 RepID=A0AAE0TT12_9PEZI|nr:hypothetical protein LTR78_007428 [Recurvomyces mirabilis]KAK5160063.1 hypothetical protein LTS14_002169 [Recurvomyces mirabilis]